MHPGLLSSRLKIGGDEELDCCSTNQTRLRVLASVLTLETFTVSELFHHAGVEPSQVYRILATLQEDGNTRFLDGAGRGGPTSTASSTKRYCLREQTDVRERLERELNSFLPDGEGAGESRQLARARQKLRSVLIRFPASCPADTIGSIFKQFEDLRSVVPGMLIFEFGTDVTPVPLSQGFTHGLTIDFQDMASRNGYWQHPGHICDCREVGATAGEGTGRYPDLPVSL